MLLAEIRNKLQAVRPKLDAIGDAFGDFDEYTVSDWDSFREAVTRARLCLSDDRGSDEARAMEHLNNAISPNLAGMVDVLITKLHVNIASEFTDVKKILAEIRDDLGTYIASQQVSQGRNP